MRRLYLNFLDWIFLLILIIGGLNWGLVGVFDYNLVTALLGVGTSLTNIIYILVGVSAIYFIFRPLVGVEETVVVAE